MRYYDFSRLIEKYSTDFVVEVPAKGGYDDSGDYIAGASTQITMRGAIINHSESKIFRSEGKLTGQDKALYMLEPLDKALQGAKVIWQDKIYHLSTELENSEFTGVWKYNLQYVSAFDNPASEGTVTQ